MSFDFDDEDEAAPDTATMIFILALAFFAGVLLWMIFQIIDGLTHAG